MFCHVIIFNSTLPEPEIHIEITVIPYEAYRHKDVWDAFVLGSMNGTVFHTQQFLAYHNEGKFHFDHLLFYKEKRLVAVLAGGLKENGKIYDSPLGASYGSFVTEDISADTALAIVAAFEKHIEANGVKEVYLTSAPVIYQPILTQNLDFALLYKGFAYQRHYISHAIELRVGEIPFNRFQPKARNYIRRITRDHPEINIEEVAKENMFRGLQEFYPILLENKAKFNAKPTHTLEELLQLHKLLPDLLKLFLVRVNNEPIAGSLLFIANPRVAIIFYHMLRYNFDEYRPIYLLMDKVTRWAQDNNFSFVDIGVSQDTHDENPMTPALSLIRFKEKFDSRGVLRSTMWKFYKS